MLVESISININRRKYAHNNLSFKATDHSELLKLSDRTIFNQIRNAIFFCFLENCRSKTN